MHPALLLADDLPPALNWHQIGNFEIDFASVLLAVVALAYAAGVWRVHQLEPGSWSAKRTVAFAAGIVVTFVSVESFIGIYDDSLFYDHMIQHLLLIMVSSALFAMGAPIELLERATTGRTGRLVRKALHSRIAELVAHPLVDFGLYAVLIPLTHLTAFYNYTLTNEQAHHAEHVLYLVLGYLFWRHVVAIEPTRHPLHPGTRLLYLALAVPVDTFTGLTLAYTNHELFPAYFQLHRTWGPSLVQDLHIGGTIMWVGGDMLMMLAMVPIIKQWVAYEERKAAEIDRQLDLERAARGEPVPGVPRTGVPPA